MDLLVKGVGGFGQNSSEFEMSVFVNEVRSARERSIWRRWQAT